MRIATQGKIRNYREFALRFLQVRPDPNSYLVSCHGVSKLTGVEASPAGASLSPSRLAHSAASTISLGSSPRSVSFD